MIKSNPDSSKIMIHKKLIISIAPVDACEAAVELHFTPRTRVEMGTVQEIIEKNVLN